MINKKALYLKIAKIEQNRKTSKLGNDENISIFFGKHLNELLLPLAYKVYKRFPEAQILEVTKKNRRTPNFIAKELRILGNFRIPDGNKFVPILIRIKVPGSVHIKYLNDPKFQQKLQEETYSGKEEGTSVPFVPFHMNLESSILEQIDFVCQKLFETLMMYEWYCETHNNVEGVYFTFMRDFVSSKSET